MRLNVHSLDSPISAGAWLPSERNCHLHLHFYIEDSSQHSPVPYWDCTVPQYTTPNIKLRLAFLPL